MESPGKILESADLSAAFGSDQILNLLPSPILVVDADGAVQRVNPAAEQFFAAGAAHLTRCNIGDIVPFGSPVLALLWQASAEGMAMSEYEVDLSTPKNGRRRANVSISPIPEHPGGAVVVLQETGIADKMSRQLTHQGAARTVTGMAAMLAHEVKNPLSGIRGAAQLLEATVDPGDAPLTRLIREETDRICALVDSMDMFSDRPDEMQTANIHAVLERVRSVAESGFGRQVRFVEHYDPSLPAVRGHFDQLVQIFLNLVKNAVEAVPADGGEVTLRTAFRHGVRLAVPGSKARMKLPLEVSVEDNGPGVPDELRPHLFDPFVTTKPDGTGLGLALVAKLVRDHGGVVECDATGQGTVFRIMLPLQETRDGAGEGSR